ncbi:phosphoribosylformylglycinamidine synthase [Methanorbis furvi]|uniref:Phosphoribosylformylglycinamidine synthase n=1 Tax=Methanorbis furvi TaxID=3028299 RepID=A0AAE4MDG3_9EURY|nr:Phosphoribosylformylglycinamidine synthase [Methanocorpusculaceae archaeon Ag1]
MVFRVFVEKKPALANEANAVLGELRTLLGMQNITTLRIINRYDADNIDRDLFEYAKHTVFSEPQLDIVSDAVPLRNSERIFAVEFLPGQFDQRADSAAQCIQLISQKERAIIKTARIYVIGGNISDDDLAAIKKYVINPIESREASLELPATLGLVCAAPEKVSVMTGFCSLDAAGLADFVKSFGLAMDAGDIAFCQQYFRTAGRDPTITEIKMIDTYWSDHCRHTTFLTTLDSVTTESPLLQKAFDDYLSVRKKINRTKPVNLMDIGTIAVKYLRSEGKLEKLDESEEVNACTVKITVTVDGKDEDWLLLFKNETHNHPTEIEPFGGAATCIGGAIRDPLSGRAYVYAAMRLTGAGNPLAPVDQTLPGKLPQRKIVTTAAAGYSSYGNQIGLATGMVDELYHPGYVAKRMEVGAVIGAAPAANVRRESPVPGDKIILLGGRTGRDGCGGATGSSKSHTAESLESCGAEVQKGNAPEERKIQRLFRNPAASTLIKRCNDFGAGGVSVAIGELADGVSINLNAVPKKYDGLDGTELAISESQERMAVVVAAADAEKFIALSHAENLEATVVAEVTAEPRVVMTWNDDVIVDISREFLNSNGVEKHISADLAVPEPFTKPFSGTFTENYSTLVGDLNICSKRGLSERFDSTIGAGAVLMPFGGKYQQTPVQAMVTKISVERGDTDDCSLMAWGYNPAIAEKSPYHSAYLAVVESVAKLVATGAEFSDVYLSFQEYFERLGLDSKRWGKPASALLGALSAQMGLGIGAIGGKDSMSGSFEQLNVPPTLISFAVTTEKIQNIISNEFKGPGHRVVLLSPAYDAESLPTTDSLLEIFSRATELMRNGSVLSCWTPVTGGIAEGVFKMALGNNIGFSYADSVPLADLFSYRYGSFILELDEGTDAVGTLLGMTTDVPELRLGSETISLTNLRQVYEAKLESVFPCNISQESAAIPKITFRDRNTAKPRVRVANPRVLIPVFPGTNCEYDSAKAVARAGAVPEVIVINNMTAEDTANSVDAVAEAIRRSHAIFIPGGFSGGDEPDGSGKFITAFFRNEKIKDAVHDLLKNRDGLICGICNGFQALIKLGLVPYGEIVDVDENSPTLTFNTIGRHQSRIVRTRVASVKSPWLSHVNVDDVFAVPISHGEGRFLAGADVVEALIANGQVATQYVDLDNQSTSDIHFNPNNSFMAIEAITSPDGRVLGKMGHSERVGEGLYRNVPDKFMMQLFESLVAYYR